MTFEELEAYRRTHPRIPPEKLLAAYKGLRVEKINPAYMARMDLTGSPHPVLDRDLRLCGMEYGWDYEKKGYIEIENDDMGTYLYKPEKDAEGNDIIPEGWVDSRAYDEFLNEMANELAAELGLC